jgi:hypothetical protein
MGYYINPPDLTKEAWLQEYGQVTTTPAWPAPVDTVMVCLVDNGPFTAAAIAYCEEEFNEFSAPSDPRPRIWYYVPIDDIVRVEPRVRELLTA